MAVPDLVVGEGGCPGPTSLRGFTVLIMILLGAIYQFAQFINCAAHYVNPRIAQQFINCYANCESYYARSIYKLRTQIQLRNL